MNGRSSRFFGPQIIAVAFFVSLAVSMYHVLLHDAPLLAIILGQGAHVTLSLLLGGAGYYALTAVESSNERHIVGVQTGAGYVLALAAAGGYSLHQLFTPEATVAVDVVLFQMTFVGIFGGMAGVVVGLNKVHRKRTIDDLEELTAELRTTQEETRTEKQRFESLFHSAPSAVVDIEYSDGEPTVERANDVFEAHLGHGGTDVEGESLFRIAPLQDDETEDEVVAHVTANEIYEGTVTTETPNGRSHYQLRVIPYEVGEDEDRAFALYTDVSELRRTQQELKASVEQLQSSNERLEQFAYAISHDLREPLRMVSSYLQLIEDRYADELDEEAREFIEFAVDGADRMQSMIESLLEYSRVTTRGEPLESTELEMVLEDVLTDLQPAIAESDATVTTEELPTVLADADQLGQVFRNLISNALKYSGNEPPRVHVGAEPMDEAWRFTVVDQGIGIPAEKHDQIFQVFETGHSEEEGSETGIGLALCKRILERHDGDIWVESEPDDGSSFHFTLPS